VAKKPADPSEVVVPSDFPASPPRDLHPTTDIRFVIHELGKLTALVDRLIGDVKTHSEKIGEVKDAITFVKGAIWVVGVVVVVVSAIVSLIMTGKVSISFH
jgi:hypothetical protein